MVDSSRGWVSVFLKKVRLARKPWFVDFWSQIPPHFYCFGPCFTHPDNILHTGHCGFHVNITEIDRNSPFLPLFDGFFS
ncbi:MAG TPA: hypothetical protein VMU62_00240, partial [Acidobacteriaceae bacterium]|nr:hypothetical protein [Acidobacteriaceae bacterium]